MTTHTDPLKMVLEKIAESWDGCIYESVGEDLDIGQQLRKQFAAMLEAVSPLLTAAAPQQAQAGEAERQEGLTFTHTQRGFALIEFADRYDVKCSLQASSLATEAAIWFGCNDANPRVLVPGEGWKPVAMPADYVADTRMHLTQEKVRELLPVLQHFAETGDVAAAMPQPQAVDGMVLVPASKLTYADCHRFGLDVDAVRAMGVEAVDDSQPVAERPFTHVELRRIISDLRMIGSGGDFGTETEYHMKTSDLLEFANHVRTALSQQDLIESNRQAWAICDAVAAALGDDLDREAGSAASVARIRDELQRLRAISFGQSVAEPEELQRLRAALTLLPEDEASFPNDYNVVVLRTDRYWELREAEERATVSQQAKVQEPVAGQWVRCTPDLIKAGVSCAKTPRRPGDGTYSHDHFISHEFTPQSDTHPGSDPVSRPGSRQNQCDGCMQGAPVNENNNHVDANGKSFMHCQAHRYMFADTTQAEAQSKEPTMSLLCRHSKGYTCEFCTYPTNSNGEKQ